MKKAKKDPYQMTLTSLVMGTSDRVMYGLGPKGEIVRIADPMSSGPLTLQIIHDPDACAEEAKAKAAKAKMAEQKKAGDDNDEKTADTNADKKGTGETSAEEVADQATSKAQDSKAKKG